MLSKKLQKLIQHATRLIFYLIIFFPAALFSTRGRRKLLKNKKNNFDFLKPIPFFSGLLDTLQINAALRWARLPASLHGRT